MMKPPDAAGDTSDGHTVLVLDELGYLPIDKHRADLLFDMAS